MRYSLALAFALLSTVLYGQSTITGRVVDASSGQPIEYVTVVANKQESGELISGTTTEQDGSFMIKVSSQAVIVEVSFIGYQKKVIDQVSFVNKKADLGDITLGEDAAILDEVVVAADKSTTEFRLDKRVFNVGADLSSTGASALEVLNNVPSVNVNIEGQVSLRGATGVQILIDGKPSILSDESSNALGTITAEMIEKVEVITNPSAKYDAEGTGGIINIVLKKNEKTGLNGSVSVNTGIPHNHSVGFSLNRRTKRFNLFTQLGAGYRELPNDNTFINRDYSRNTQLLTIGKEYRNENFYNIILGSDYHINETNVITVSGSFAYEVESQPSKTTFALSRDRELEQSWQRTEVTSATNPKLQYELQYSSDFKDHKEHKLLFSAIGNYFGKDLNSTFSNRDLLDNQEYLDQLTATAFAEGKYTFKLDYTKPLADGWTVETGFQYLLNDVSNDFEVQNEQEDGSFVVNEGLTNTFEYNQNVLGVYTTGAYEGDVWGLKLGLRAENTDLKTLLINTGEGNDRNFTNLFPTLHTSYKVSDRLSMQAGYSRRISRPRLWDLNPFFNIRNDFNIFAGNPLLLPEFSDSYEMGVIYILDQVSLNSNVYYRYTTDMIDRVSIFNDGITTWRPQNIGTNRSLGLEANFKYSPNRKLTLSGDANYNVFQREGVFQDQNFDFDADRWSGKLTTKYKINKSLDAEVTGRYDSREQNIQGIRRGNLYADCGLRYKILDGRGVFNFSVRDIFASRVRQQTIDNSDFYTFSRRQRGRFVTFGFSYGFGKGEAMQYSGRRRR